MYDSEKARMVVVSSLVAQSIFGLLQILGWNRVSIVYEKDTYEEEVSSILIPNLHGIPTIEHEINMKSLKRDIKHFLDGKVYDYRNTRILILCNVICVKELMFQIHHHEYLQQGLFRFKYQWLIVTDDNLIGDTEIDVFNIRDIAVLSTKPALMLHTAIYTKNGRRFEYLGEYEKPKWLLNNEIFPNGKYYFNGRHFKVLTMYWEPFMYSRSYAGENFTGLCKELLDYLATHYNFTYTLSLPSDMQWGHIDENGTWNGLIGALNDREADLVVAPLTALFSREEVMDFTFPFYTEFLTALYLKPSTARQVDLYLRPFKHEVWIVILLSLPMVALAIYLIKKLSPLKDKEVEEFNKILLHVYGAFMNKGDAIQPTSGSNRLIISCWWIFCVIITATYSANLIAFLSVEIYYPPFNNLQELYNQDEYTFGTTFHAFFKMAEDDLIKNIWKKMHQQKQSQALSADHSTHIQMVYAGRYAYLSDLVSFEVEMRNSCDVAVMKEKFSPVYYAIGLQNNSAYEDLFSYGIIKLVGEGMVEKWKRMHWPQRKLCGHQVSSRPFTVTDVQGVFYLVFSALLLATNIFICEILCKRITQNKLRNEKKKEITDEESQ